jgi:DNA-binding ferritin-like protein
MADNADAASFVSVLFHSGTNAHFMHLQTDSFAVHSALDTYYHEIIDLTDAFAEAYQGCYKVITNYPNTFHSETDPVKYLTKISEFVRDFRVHLPKDTQLQNLIDEIAALIDSTLYKLRFLK